MKPTLDLASLVQKGQAIASVSPAQAEARVSNLEQQPQIAKQPSAIPKGGQSYWKAMTVKLDRTQYNALKVCGVMQNRTSQDCISDAVNLWIAQQDQGNDTQ